MIAQALLLWALFAVHTVGLLQEGSPHQKKHEVSEVLAQTSYGLRLCNAFAWPAPLEMSRLQEPKIMENPLPYKACQDYKLPLKNGDVLRFRAGQLVMGTFTVSGLPDPSKGNPSEDKDNILLLVPYRLDNKSNTVAFSSHMFERSDHAQIAIIDTYRGPNQGTMHLKEGQTDEVLPFNTVVSLNSEMYGFSLRSNNITEVKFRPKRQELYTLVRIGLGQTKKDPWPEELLLYPSQASQQSKGVRASTSILALVLLFTNVAQKLWF